MIVATKVKLYPNEKQKILLEKHFGSCRFVYNY
ncbi:MAG: helix-turn-helix domain-containing protein, partial [Thermoplasmata archaeon]